MFSNITYSIADFREEHCRSVSGVFEKLSKLEHLKYSVQTFDCVNNHHSDVKKALPNLSHLKTLTFKSLVKSNWYQEIMTNNNRFRTSMNDGAGQFLIDLIRAFPTRINPNTFTYQFHK